jgi:hypothetical protein
MATAIIIIRAPYRSSKRPARIMKTPAIREPAVYMPDTKVLDQPKSAMMGSTKIETE